MDSRQSPSLAGALDELERYGLLLESDRALPNLVTLITGGPVRGSWWGHPDGHEIYATSRQLSDHPDVAVTKLVSGKRTYVHRRLWSALIAIGSAREPWQLDGASATSKKLLEFVTENGEIRTDELPPSGPTTLGDAVRQLETRLLVQGQEVHTELGRHAKRLQTWERWAAIHAGTVPRVTSEQGKNAFADVLAGLNGQFGARGRLPWDL